MYTASDVTGLDPDRFTALFSQLPNNCIIAQQAFDKHCLKTAGAGSPRDVRQIKMPIKHVDVQEADRLQTAEGYAYIDVRSIPEYDGGHPAGAHNVPLLHYDAQTGQKTPNSEFLAVMQANYSRDAKLLIGCQIGGRSTQAAQLLTSRGYQHVANVRGGFGGAHDPATGALVDEGWSMAGLPVETTAPPGGSYEELRKNLT